MIHARAFSFAALLLAATLPGVALAHNARQQVTPPPAAAKPVPAAHDENRGQRAWEANCSRCHNAPETLNPRIAGTVIRHMRVRANLSAQDEQDILRFLNP